MRRPSRITVSRSQTAIVSLILWVMKTTDMSSSTILRSEANRSSTSWGVRFVVGSSRARILAPRYSALRISTRWRMPTGVPSTMFSTTV
ncbi:Uncharacterised protein [Mycobacteroides abscessus subsp. abscessus]|nr:Uncharacterised protein [Mycobacteroides abscessus subsp. abscessus]